MRTEYKRCLMDGKWHVVKDNKILSYQEFEDELGAWNYCRQMNQQLKSLEDLEERIGFPR